ncbi:hypothetical protein [Pseudomonas sp. LB3P31]
MSLNTAETAFLYIGLANFAGMMIWFCFALHLAYTRMDEMLERLKNCSAILRRAPLRFGGPFGKLLLVGGISGVITFPNLYLRLGGVSIDDLNAFPASLKRKLAVMQWTLWGSIVVMCSLFVFGKYIGAIN